MLKAALFDLDGTIYRGNEAIVESISTVNSLINHGVHCRFLTNNSAATKLGTSKKLQDMGIPCDPDWIYSSGLSTIQHIQKLGYSECYVVGESSLHRLFLESQINPASDEPQAVVVGVCRTFNYEILNHAMQGILNGADFIATNLDPTYPIEGGQFQPGAGSIVAAVRTATGVSPFVIGKPEPDMAIQVCADLNIKTSEAILIGDRLDTDIACGIAAGCQTWLVLSGVEKQIPEGQPGSHCISSILDLF